MLSLFTSLFSKISAAFMSVIMLIISAFGFGIDQPDTTDIPFEPTTIVGEHIDMSPQEILSKYTEVVNQLKEVDKPGHYSVVWQEMPMEYRNCGVITNIVLSFAEDYGTDKEEAAESMQFYDSGYTYDIPIYNNDKGCLLTDVSCIKSATMVDNLNGTYTITIVLNDEDYSEPAGSDALTSPSSIGAMFTPLSHDDIESALSEIDDFDINDYHFTYTDCTASVTFYPETNHVTSLFQTMNIDVAIDVHYSQLTLTGSARVVNNISIFGFEYD